jgi:hypothetical protein
VETKGGSKKSDERTFATYAGTAQTNGELFEKLNSKFSN